MVDEMKGEKSPRRERPRGPRVPVNFPVELEWRDAVGQLSTARAEAVKVSRGGGTLKTGAEVAVGTILRLTPPFGRSIEAEVNGVWVDETDGARRIGIKLLEANGWFVD